MLRACRAVADVVAASPSLARQMIESDGCAALASVLRDHASRVSVCSSACAALAACWGPKHLLENIPTPQPGLAELVALLQRYSTDASVCSPAFAALGCLTRSGPSCGRLLVSGGMESLMEVLASQLSGPAALIEVCATGLHVISELAICSFDNLARQTAAGKLALSALERCPSHVSVQAASCHLLGNVLISGLSAGELSAAGAASAVLDALRRHPKLPEVANHAAAVLWQLRRADELSVSQEAAVKEAAVAMLGPQLCPA